MSGISQQEHLALQVGPVWQRISIIESPFRDNWLHRLDHFLHGLVPSLVFSLQMIPRRRARPAFREISELTLVLGHESHNVECSILRDGKNEEVLVRCKPGDRE
jgi:hypothetical protein